MPTINQFGRHYAPDERDQLHPMQAVLQPQPLPEHRYYHVGKDMPLDQGETGTCVAHGWAGFLKSAPLMDKFPINPFDDYRGIVLVDEFEDNDFEAKLPNDQLQFGSSVRGGAKYHQSKGRLKRYVWADTADTMKAFILSSKGTIVLGTNWYWDMSTPDATGLVNVGGGVAGGHCYLCIGYSQTTRRFRCINSWNGWGYRNTGVFEVMHDDMDRLIHEDGEACAAVEQHAKVA